MKRRSFLQWLGLTPAVAVIPAAAAEPEVHGQLYLYGPQTVAFHHGDNHWVWWQSDGRTGWQRIEPPPGYEYEQSK